MNENDARAVALIVGEAEQTSMLLTACEALWPEFNWREMVPEMATRLEHSESVLPNRFVGDWQETVAYMVNLAFGGRTAYVPDAKELRTALVATRNLWADSPFREQCLKACGWREMRKAGSSGR